ncbi:MAG: hypothetical protein ACREKS_21815, partial [Candidatus Rokuibacteriota bacterium]
YPNGLPGGVPAEVFSRGQASEAIAHAAAFLEQASAIRIPDPEDGDRLKRDDQAIIGHLL